MTGAQRPVEVLIVNSSPIYARALQRLIEDKPAHGRSEILLDPITGRLPAALPPDLALLAPRDWRELGAWISPMQKRLADMPWVVLSDLQTVGLFLLKLDAQPCVVVDPATVPDELVRRLHLAASGDCWHLPTTLLSRFMRSKTARSNAPYMRMPSLSELAVCCGVALGLSNPEIAAALHLSEAAIKTHLHRLTSRMDLGSRAELGHLINNALAYRSQSRELDAQGLALTL